MPASFFYRQVEIELVATQKDCHGIAWLAQQPVDIHGTYRKVVVIVLKIADHYLLQTSIINYDSLIHPGKLTHHINFVLCDF